MFLFVLIASLLLDSLLSHLSTKERSNCKAAYLHVLSTNIVALKFYERRNFAAHSFLPYYYSIQGKPRDGYSYVLYINGGQPPWSVLYPFKHKTFSLIKVIILFSLVIWLKSYTQTTGNISYLLMVQWVFGSILQGGPSMCYPVCGMVHIKVPLLQIEKSSPCSGSSRFPLLLSE